MQISLQFSILKSIYRQNREDLIRVTEQTVNMLFTLTKSLTEDGRGWGKEYKQNATGPIILIYYRRNSMSLFETSRQKFGYYIKSQKQPVRGAKNSDMNIQRVEVNRGEWQEINKECLKVLYQEIVGRVYY